MVDDCDDEDEDPDVSPEEADSLAVVSREWIRRAYISEQISSDSFNGGCFRSESPYSNFLSLRQYIYMLPESEIYHLTPLITLEL